MYVFTIKYFPYHEFHLQLHHLNTISHFYDLNLARIYSIKNYTCVGGLIKSFSLNILFKTADLPDPVTINLIYFAFNINCIVNDILEGGGFGLLNTAVTKFLYSKNE